MHHHIGRIEDGPTLVTTETRDPDLQVRAKMSRGEFMGIKMKSRAIERLSLLGFIGFLLLSGFLWADRGVSSFLTQIAIATAVVNLIGFVVAVRSRRARETNET